MSQVNQTQITLYKDDIFVTGTRLATAPGGRHDLLVTYLPAAILPSSYYPAYCNSLLHIPRSQNHCMRGRGFNALVCFFSSSSFLYLCTLINTCPSADYAI